MFFDISCFVHFEGTTYVLFYEWLLTTSLTTNAVWRKWS